MSDLSERKRAAVHQKIASLQGEFDRWRKETEEHSRFEKHQSQVIALTAHLEGLSTRTQQLFDQSVAKGTLLASGRNIESLVLGLLRIWEFFRAKLAQRLDPRMLAFLQAADELAWACYRPVLELRSQARKQPPLVFLNGGLSPYALSRDQAFLAENVPGEPLSGRTYDAVLQRLPIAMIGVPWYQVEHLPDLPVVAHETGHAVENDFCLHPCVLANLKAGLGEGHVHLKHWQSWASEVFADVWGTLTMGPAYPSSLADFLAADPKTLEDEVAEELGRYPTTHMRMRLCTVALGRMGFNTEAQQIDALWQARYGSPLAKGWFDDIEKVVEATLESPLEGSGINSKLLDLTHARMSDDDWGLACDAAGQVDANDVPIDTATTIVRWAAAARRLYDMSPTKYVEQKFGQSLLDYSAKLIKPGTRSGEEKLAPSQLEALEGDSHTDGAAWFEDFANWSAPAT